MLRSAVKAGIKPSEFWDMTPVELTITVDAYVANQTGELKQALTAAYMNATWQRAKKMPRLETVLNKIDSTTQRKTKRNKKQQTAEEMLAVVMTLTSKQAKRGE